MSVAVNFGLRCTFGCHALHQHLLGALGGTVHGSRGSRHETSQGADDTHVGGLGVGLETWKKGREDKRRSCDVRVIDGSDRVRECLQTVLSRTCRVVIGGGIGTSNAQQGLSPQGTEYEIDCIYPTKF